MKILTDKCRPWFMQCPNQRSRKILKSYSRLLKMNTPVSPWIFALKSWRPKEWLYTSSYPENSLTILSAKHCGTVKAREVSSQPPSLLSQTLSDIHTWQRTTGGRTARGKFFSPSLVIMMSTLQMRPIILLCCIFWKFFKVERTLSRYCFRTGAF